MAPVGVRAHPDDIVVTAGSQMALDLVVRVFCDPGDVVLVEAPTYVKRKLYVLGSNSLLVRPPEVLPRVCQPLA